MARLTIAQMREREVEALAEKTGLDEAYRIMNSFYRLCGLEERLLYLDNDASTCNLRTTAELEERAERWRKRLQATFKQYGMELIYFGYLPTICKEGTTETAVRTFFYN